MGCRDVDFIGGVTHRRQRKRPRTNERRKSLETENSKDVNSPGSWRRNQPSHRGTGSTVKLTVDFWPPELC